MAKKNNKRKGASEDAFDFEGAVIAPEVPANLAGLSVSTTTRKSTGRPSPYTAQEFIHPQIGSLEARDAGLTTIKLPGNRVVTREEVRRKHGIHRATPESLENRSLLQKASDLFHSKKVSGVKVVAKTARVVGKVKQSDIDRCLEVNLDEGDDLLDLGL